MAIGLSQLAGGGVSIALNGIVPNGYVKHPDYSTIDVEFGLTNNQLISGATARYGHSAIHYNDGTNDKMIVFGGNNGTSNFNDTWEYNIDTDAWTQLTSGATARRYHSAIHYNDGTNDKMIVFGGNNGTSYLNDTWEYNIDTDAWTQLTSGATARFGHSAIHYNDGTNDKMIVFGGYNGTPCLNDTWEYNIDTSISLIGAKPKILISEI